MLSAAVDDGLGSISRFRTQNRERTVEEFTVELAEVPVRIRCKHHQTRSYLAAFSTDREPYFTVEPEESDLARVQAEFDRTAALEERSGEALAPWYLENTAVHALLAEGLTAYNVLLMHGSALSMDGKAYIFTASSGTGKSTHARLWRELYGERVVMINDDKPMLRIADDGITVYGTPWRGKHRLGMNGSAPLCAIVSLERGAENRIEPMQKAEAFPVLMKQAFSSKDPATMTRILAMEQTLLEKIPFFLLHCNMDPDAARVAYEGMRERIR